MTERKDADVDIEETAVVRALRAENVQMRTRITEMEQSQTLLQSIVDNGASVIFVKDTEGRYITINRRYEVLFHVTREEIRGKTDYDIYPEAVADRLRDHDRLVIAGGEPIHVEEAVPSDDGIRHYVVIKFPIRSADGTFTAVCGIATDITERKHAEEERAALHAQIIEAQRTSLRELSTPLIPLGEGVLVMPIIGTVDSARAAQIMDTLLEGIVAQQARMAILDITGVMVVDTQVANALIKAAKSVKLLGAEVVLTGIRAPVARTLIDLGIGLDDIVTLGTLRAGIAYSLRRGEAGGRTSAFPEYGA
jgi:rsbT co-antagonist protein RsbR